MITGFLSRFMLMGMVVTLLWGQTGWSETVSLQSNGRELVLITVPNQFVVGVDGGAKGSRDIAKDLLTPQRSALRDAAGIESARAVGNGLVLIQTTDGAQARSVLAAAPEFNFVFPLYRLHGSKHLVFMRPSIVVKVAHGTNVEDVATRHEMLVERGLLYTTDQFVLAVNPANDIFKMLEQIQQDPDVVWADIDFAMQRDRRYIPNDPLFTEQWHLQNTGQGGGTPGADVKAPAAWAQHRASENIIVAVCDDAVDIYHPDLVIWTNPDEIPDNGIDDDLNGLIDDVHGWNFASNNNNPGPDYFDRYEGDWHGTSVAGVTGAIGDNNLGVTGAAFGITTLPVKLVVNGEFAEESALADAMRYAARYAHILNNSWGGSHLSSVMDEALNDATGPNGSRGELGVPVLFAAGNDARFYARYIPTTLLSDDEYLLQLEYTQLSEPTGLAFLEVFNIQIYDEEDELVSSIAPYYGTTPFGVTLHGSVPMEIAHSEKSEVGYVYRTVNMAAGDTAVLSWNIDLTDIYSELNHAISVEFRANIPPDQGIFRLFLDGNEITGEGLAGSSDLDILFPYTGTTSDNGAPIVGEAAHPRVIAIGASNNYDTRSLYSQWGPELKFMAPSNGGSLAITTTDVSSDGHGYNPGSAYTDDFGGTSSACPLSSGVFALTMSANPSLSSDQLVDIMRHTAVKIGGVEYDQQGFHLQYGYGKLDMSAAVALALSMLDTTPTPVADTPTPVATPIIDPTLTPQPTSTPGDEPSPTPVEVTCGVDRLLRRKVCCEVIPAGGVLVIEDRLLSWDLMPTIQIMVSANQGASWYQEVNPENYSIELGEQGGRIVVYGQPNTQVCMHLIYPVISGPDEEGSDVVGPSDLLELLGAWHQPTP